MQAHSSTSLYLAKHFALLLLDDETTILKDITASAGILAPRLIHYIRSSPPTKSFAKVSARASISITDIRQLADHLVYWRRARAVPPLHQRDTYIVSPNADMRKLAAACRAYEATFPTLPSLPKMLSALSGTPRPYGTLIPSKDHKEAYFQILAWLLRGGWVTQLRTFAWIRVDKEVKVAVDKAMREERKKERRDLIHSTHSEANGNDDNSSVRSNSISDTGSSRHRPSLHEADRSFSGSQSSFSAAVTTAAAQSFPATQNSTSTKASSHQFNTDLSTASLILNPIRASPLESAYLSYISEHVLPSSNLSEEEMSELKQYFMSFAKSMDGTEALEKIPLKEGMKRAKVWELLGRMGVIGAGAGGMGGNGTRAGGSSIDDDDGLSREDGLGKGKRFVVSVRHW